MTLWRLGVVAASKSATPSGIYFGVILASDSTTTNTQYFMNTETSATFTGTRPSANRGACFGSMAFNDSHGYAAGGYVAGVTHKDVTKMTWSTLTFSALPTGLNTSRADSMALQSSTFALICGGYTDSPTYAKLNSIEKFTFATDARSLPATTLSANAHRAGNASGSSAGYIMGGITGVATVDKITFATEARTTTPSLSPGVNDAFGHASTTHGYSSGGYELVPSPAAGITRRQKISFADDSRSGTNALSIGSRGNGFSGAWTSTVAAYMGGDTPSLNKMTYAADTSSTVSNTINFGAGRSPAGTNSQIPSLSP